MAKRKKKVEEPKPRKAEFEFNQAQIRDAYMDILKAGKGRRPTLAQVAEATGLSITTVKKHIDELDLSDMRLRSKSLKVLTDDVALAIYRAAMKGNPASQKLWFQIVEGWSEKTATEHSGKVETGPPTPPVILKITKE